MTTELEQKFYDIFGIEKIKDFNYCNGGIVEYCLKYPEITAEKLLQMICICSSYVRELNYDYEINAKNIDDLKKEILEDCIEYAKENQEFKHQIQQLFKEEQ